MTQEEHLQKETDEKDQNKTQYNSQNVNPTAMSMQTRDKEVQEHSNDSLEKIVT